MKMRSMAFEFFRADGRTDTHDEANNHFFAIFQTPLKTVQPVSYYYSKLEAGTRIQEVSGLNLGRDF